MWVNHVPGEPEYVDDTGPNLQNYNHTPIANNHHTDCWPFSYKMRERGVAPKEGLDGANYKMVKRGDGGMDLFIVGKIHQFWRDGAHPHLMMPGLSINSKDQTHEVWKFKNYNPRQLTLTLDSPDNRLYSGGTSPRLGILRETPISNDKIGAEYGTLSSLAKCDARTKDRSGTYHERKTDTKYGQNLTQVFHDLDLYGYTVGALNYPHTKGRILELPKVSPWTTDKPWSGHSIGDRMLLPGRGITINPLQTNTGDFGSIGSLRYNYFLSREDGPEVIGNPNNISLPSSDSRRVVDDRIRATALILGMTKLVVNKPEFKWNTSNISYGWSVQDKENPYDLTLFKNPLNGPFDYFTINSNGRIQEDKNVSRKRTLESGDGIPLSEWYRQYKVTPAHFHVSRIANVDQKAGRDTNTTGEEKFYLNITAFTDVLTDSNGGMSSSSIYRTPLGYFHPHRHNYAVVRALKYIITGEAVYGNDDARGTGVWDTDSMLSPNATYLKSEATAKILKFIEDNPLARGGELNLEQQNRMFVEVNHTPHANFAGIGQKSLHTYSDRPPVYYTNSVFDTSVGTFIQRKVNNVEQDSNGFILKNDPDDNILSSAEVAGKTFREIGSRLQRFEVNNGRSLTDTADCTHANLYCRWHLKYKNETGEEGIFFQIPWNMTKSNTSFSNYLLQIENEKYDGTTVTQTADPNNPKTIDDARNYFSEFVSNRQVVPGVTPDNIPASKLVRDMFRLKGENIIDAGKFPDGNGGFLAADNKTLGYYYPSSKAALVHLNKEDATNLNHRTDRDVAVKTTADGNATDDIFAEDGSRMPRMTATAPDAGDIDKQPETISFVDYAPINNYESLLDKYHMNNDPEVLIAGMKFYRRKTWAGMDSSGFDKDNPTDSELSSIIPDSGVSYIDSTVSPNIELYMQPARANNYVLTVKLKSSDDEAYRIVIVDTRPGTPDARRSVVAELYVPAGDASTTFKIPVVQDPDPADREIPATEGPGTIEASNSFYNPVIIDFKNAFELGKIHLRGVSGYTHHGGSAYENSKTDSGYDAAAESYWKSPNEGHFVHILEQPTSTNGYQARISFKTSYHDSGQGSTGVRFQVWQDYKFRGVNYSHPVCTADSGQHFHHGDRADLDITTYTVNPTPVLSGGYGATPRLFSDGTAHNQTDGTPANMAQQLNGKYIGTGRNLIRGVGNAQTMRLYYAAVASVDTKYYSYAGEDYNYRGTFVHPGNTNAKMELHTYNGGLYINYLYYYHPLTAGNVTTGYPALVANGIVPRNHNKLLGLPHILNQPNPQNLILPS